MKCVSLLILLLFSASLSPMVLGSSKKNDNNINVEETVEPQQFVEIEGYLTPGMYDDYGYPYDWTPFYLYKGEKVGITIRWNPPAKMKVGIIYEDGTWAAFTTPIQGSEVIVEALIDGLYYVRIQNDDNNLSTQYSGWFIIY